MLKGSRTGRFRIFSVFLLCGSIGLLALGINSRHAALWIPLTLVGIGLAGLSISIFYMRAIENVRWMPGGQAINAGVIGICLWVLLKEYGPPSQTVRRGGIIIVMVVFILFAAWESLRNIDPFVRWTFGSMAVCCAVVTSSILIRFLLLQPTEVEKRSPLFDFYFFLVVVNSPWVFLIPGFAIGLKKQAKAVGTLIEALRHPRTRVRRMAVISLVDIVLHQRRLRRLDERRKSKDFGSWLRAFVTIDPVILEKAESALIEAQQDADDLVRRDAAEAVREIHPNWAID